MQVPQLYLTKLYLIPTGNRLTFSSEDVIILLPFSGKTVDGLLQLTRLRHTLIAK